MAIVLDGTSGITNDSGYTGDGVSFADSTPANTLVTTSGGNVGIGTSSPLAPLSIGSGSLTDVNVPVQINATSLVDAYYGINKNGGYGALYGYSAIGAAAIIKTVNAEPIIFYTANTTERARIDSSGRLLVGTTTGIANGTFCVKSNYVGAEACSFQGGSNNFIVTFHNTSGTLIGSITGSTGSTTAYNTSSDYRLKENIAPMTGALATVAQLKPCTYTWKVDGAAGQGFIAHELQEVVPECVTGEKDAVNEDGSIKPQGIDTSFLVATLTAAIQEQQAIITALTARVEALEGAQA
jgi:hypothetical protein